MTVAEAKITRLQLGADGSLWHATGLSAPSVTADYRGLIDEIGQQASPHFRVIGSSFNAPLIVELYQRYCSPRLSGRLEVASPNLCESEQELRDPTISLYRMRQWNVPPSLGGWHRVDELDYPIYAMSAQFQRDRGRVGEHLRLLWKSHPLYHDLTFLPTINHDAVIDVVTMVMDPRWFIDTRNPYRLSRLKTYLGLSPRCVHEVMAGRGSHTRGMRCRMVIGSWFTQNMSAGDMERPGNFLWRRWRAAGSGTKGILRASQAFVAYLARAWQHRLVAKSVHRAELFAPDEMLQPGEFEAYKRHIAASQSE